MPIQRIAHSSTEIDVENYIGILRAGQSISDTGWSIYADSAGVNPVFGFGGSPSITWSQNTISPLSGEVDLRLVKDANDRQGNGVSIPFTIANRHLGKVLQITFDMELFSGTYATGDLRVSIIQDPSGTPVVIEPVNTGIQLGIANQRIRHIASFQTHISITSYRLCVHVSNASTVAYTVDFANFKVWEPTQSIGAVITDWQNYTPTFSGMGTVTNINTQWRRVGGSIEVRGNFTTGSVPNAVHSFTLPSGFTTNVGWSSGNGILVGYISRNTSSESGTVGLLARNDNFIYISQYVGVASNNVLAINGANNYLSSTELQNFYLSVPIAGWGSNVAMSSDSNEGRVVAAKYRGLTVQSYTANTTPIRWDTVVYDTHNAVTTGSGWRFTAPISGQYRVSFTYLYQATDSSNVGVTLWINGDNTRIERLTDINNQIGWSASTTIFLRAGEYFDLRLNTTKSLNTDNGTISIERISAGSQVVASVEGVGCRYTSISGQTIGTNTVILFGTRENDTHGAYNSSTGIFTAPMSGWYQIRANVVLNTNTLSFLEIQRDSSTTLVYLSYPSNRGSISTVSYLIGGQTLRIRGTANTNTVLSTGSGDNSLDIVRIGI